MFAIWSYQLFYKSSTVSCKIPSATILVLAASENEPEQQYCNICTYDCVLNQKASDVMFCLATRSYKTWAEVIPNTFILTTNNNGFLIKYYCFIVLHEYAHIHIYVLSDEMKSLNVKTCTYVNSFKLCCTKLCYRLNKIIPRATSFLFVGFRNDWML